ncbi:hypothetical protein Tco_1416952 [Tanacetum coccineum]
MASIVRHLSYMAELMIYLKRNFCTLYSHQRKEEKRSTHGLPIISKSGFYDKHTKEPILTVVGTDNQEKDEKQSQNDKTGLGMEKTVKDKAKSKPESQSSQKVNRKVNWSKSKSTPKPKSQQTKKYKFKG